ncbi:MAG TPA: ribbon-helix-helix protein, CopG family [Thermoanaerobaculia bacterium]
MKTAVSIPDPLFEEADELAEKTGMSRSQLYAVALRNYVDSQRQADITETLNRIYANEPSELDPVLARLQSLSLPRDDW